MSFLNKSINIVFVLIVIDFLWAIESGTTFVIEKTKIRHNRKIRDSYGGQEAPEGPPPYISTLWHDKDVLGDKRLVGLGIFYSEHIMIVHKTSADLIREWAQPKFMGWTPEEEEDRKGRFPLTKGSSRRNYKKSHANYIDKINSTTRMIDWFDVEEFFDGPRRSLVDWYPLKHREYNGFELDVTSGILNHRGKELKALDYLMEISEKIEGSKFVLLASVAMGYHTPHTESVYYHMKLVDDPPYKHLNHSLIETDENNWNGEDDDDGEPGCFLYTYSRSLISDMDIEEKGFDEYYKRFWHRSKILQMSRHARQCQNNDRCEVPTSPRNGTFFCNGIAELGSPVYCGRQQKLTYLVEENIGEEFLPGCFNTIIIRKIAPIWRFIKDRKRINCKKIK